MTRIFRPLAPQVRLDRHRRGSARVATSYGIGYAQLVVNDGYVSTPDNDVYNVTQTLEIICLVRYPDWTPATKNGRMVNKRDNANDRSFSFLVTTAVAGRLAFNWSTDGTGATGGSLNSTASVPAADGEHLWCRMVFDLDNGASQHQVDFYTSQNPIETPPDSVSWTQLGTSVTGAGTTSIFNSTQPLSVGAYSGEGNDRPSIYYAKVIVDGVAVAEPDFRWRTDFNSPTQLTDVRSKVWTFTSPAYWVLPLQTEEIGAAQVGRVAVLTGVTGDADARVGRAAILTGVTGDADARVGRVAVLVGISPAGVPFPWPPHQLRIVRR